MCETAQARGGSPSTGIAPRRVPATPLTSEISRQSKFWSEQEEQANKTDDYRATGFVLEVFIPVDGREKGPRGGQSTQKGSPCCVLAPCVQHDGIPRSQRTLNFCRKEPFPGRLTACPRSWRFVRDVSAASACLPRARGRGLLVRALPEGGHRLQTLPQGEGPRPWGEFSSG